MADPRTPSTAGPQDIVSIVRSADAPRDLRLFAARGLLPLERDDRLRALLAVVEDADPDIKGPARETLAAVPPDDAVRFLDEGDPTRGELDTLSQHSEDPFVLERIIRHREVGDETLLRLAGNVAGAAQDALIVNQVRLIRQPALIDALLANPFLTPDGRRRIRELQEEFFEKEARRREQERVRREEEEHRARQEAEGVVFEEAAEAATDSADPLAALGEEVPEEEFNRDNLAQIFRRISVMTVKEKVEVAQKGTREERRILIADVNKIVSLAVLKSESIGAAEVETFCAMRHLHTEIFLEIASSREWIKRPKIQFALVTNPAVPLSVTLPLVKYLNMRDLRNIGRDRNLPEGIRMAARKILFDKHR
ncbi:MAG: hypothetical protein WEB59_05965 [Thermoanaerobaculia bacterium]